MATTQESREPKRGKIPLGPVDPDVEIPPSVRAAAARAEALHKAAYPEPSPQESSPGANASADTAAQSQAEPPGEPQAGAPELSISPATGAPPEVNTQEQATQQPSQDHKVENGSWEQRYIAMKGRWEKSEQNVLHMAQQITNLQNVLATMQAQPAPQAQPPSELRIENLVTPEEVQEYGPEFMDLVGRKAKEAAGPLVQSLQSEIQGLKQQLGYVGSSLAQDGRERMLSQLTAQLPEWADINHDPKFISWLALPDPFSGVIRHNLLKAAWDRNDTARSLAFFKGFLAEEAAVDPAGRVQPNGSHAPRVPNTGQQQNGKVPLETFAAPGRAKSAAEIPAEKPFIKRSEIAAFYAAVQRGVYRDQPQEQRRLEAMIIDANNNGRVING